MGSLTAQTLCEIIHGQLVSGPTDRVVSGGVGTDSRKIAADMAFFALSGEKFDGNLFAPQASKSGAAAVVVSSVPEGVEASCAVILVPDVLLALQVLAEWWRERLETLKVVAITGSSGKTSTKDLTLGVLSQQFRTTATLGNLNNHIGVPLSVLRAETSDEAAIWEMGMNHAGELAPLCRMIQPQVGIISSIGSAHIEFLGTRDAIAVEKCTLARCLPSCGAMIYPLDCDYAGLIESSTQAKCIGVGIGKGAVRAEELSLSAEGSIFRLVIDGFCDGVVHLPLHGEHMVSNALLAAAAGWVLGVSAEDIIRGLEQANLTGGRLKCEERKGILVVDDTYNANPESMKAAIQTLSALVCNGKRWAVLGKMGELGAHSLEAHREVGRIAVESNIDVLISVGSEARSITEGLKAADGKKLLHFDTREEAADYLKNHLAQGDAVLFKGSRSAGMEQVIQFIFNH